MNPLAWPAESREYLSEVQVEFKKVTWPTQKETIAGTVGVVFICVAVSVGLFVVDWLLSWIMTTLLP